jgi:hypothetical protein
MVHLMRNEAGPQWGMDLRVCEQETESGRGGKSPRAVETGSPAWDKFFPWNVLSSEAVKALYVIPMLESGGHRRRFMGTIKARKHIMESMNRKAACERRRDSAKRPCILGLTGVTDFLRSWPLTLHPQAWSVPGRPVFA